jgi:spore maturation protein CgeB
VRVLFASLRFDYGDPSRGDSFEYENLWDALRRTDGIDARFFGTDEQSVARGQEGMNTELLRVASEWQPDLVFCFLLRDELHPETLAALREIDGVTTLNWFADDHWRFQDFSRHWAPRFDWVVTTDARAVPRYASIGLNQVIHSQWAASHHVYRPTGATRDIDVSFVGQPYGKRRELVEALQAAGVEVETWGHGWERGRLGQQELVDVFSRSKISLNFAASSPRYSARYMAAQFAIRRAPRERNAASRRLPSTTEGSQLRDRRLRGLAAHGAGGPARCVLPRRRGGGHVSRWTGSRREGAAVPRR